MLHTFGPVISDQGVRFRLWAPAARRVELLLDKPIAMTPEDNGWYVADVAGAAAGTRYKFRIDGEVDVPDPASAFQPNDVFGPGEVIDHGAYAWLTTGWRGRPWHETVILEAHVGAFTPDGTYRAAIDKLDGLLDTGKAWTAGATLPGGDFPVDGVSALEADVKKLAPVVPDATVHRLVRTYGTRAKEIVSGARGLGRIFGADLSEREAAYLVENEWARTADDILWRRTKLGLRLTQQEKSELSGWLAEHAPRVA